MLADPDAHRLAKRLAGLPLALATAGAYLRKKKLTFHQYLEAYEQRFNIDPRRAVNLEEYADKTLHTTWDLTYRQLEEEDLLATKLLKLLAYFDNQEIWFELLHAGIGFNSPDWLQEVAGDRIGFENVMGILADYCLIEDQPGTDFYSMHNCVHDWTLACLNQVQSEQMFWYAVQCVTNSVDMDDWESLGQLRYARVTLHAQRCSIKQFQWLTNHAFSSDHLKQIVSIADILRSQIQYATAERMYLQALAGYEKLLGPNHISTLRTINNLGLLYTNQGKLDMTKKMHERALAMSEQTLGSDHNTTLDIVHNFGALYWNQGKFDEAEQMYLRAMAGKEQILGPDHTSTLNTIHNLGVLYRNQGKLCEAEQMYERALTGCKKTFGPVHPSTLRIVNSLGVLYQKQDKPDEAERMLQQALAGYEETFGPNHILTLDTIYNLGLVYYTLDKLNEAEQMYRQALAGMEKVLGPDHISTLNTVDNLGILYYAQEKLDEAEQMYQRALAGKERVLGPDHASTLNTVYNLGYLYYTSDRLIEAELMRQRALFGGEA